ncbi:hypothetical protein ACHAXA_010326 [Cyclostephanos tholiformis]|uniref:signal peptidase I n=1 Tax=Cyclostephanos tholiformis TaxID=382380 RepID=A0ABD3RH70_9STRA
MTRTPHRYVILSFVFLLVSSSCPRRVVVIVEAVASTSMSSSSSLTSSTWAALFVMPSSMVEWWAGRRDRNNDDRTISTFVITPPSTSLNMSNNKDDDENDGDGVGSSWRWSSSSSSSSSSPKRLRANNNNDDDAISKFLSDARTAASDGFGTRARNVGTSMMIGDVVVPICGDLERRQTLARVGLYAGVEYTICDVFDDVGDDDGGGGTGGTEDGRTGAGRIVTLRPAYPLRRHLERSDWPITIHISDVPLWLSKSTHEAGTALGALLLSGTYLAFAFVLSTVLRIAVVPSESMMPALMPGDVVLVTRSTMFNRPRTNDVVFFDPPIELDHAIANSRIGRAIAEAAGSAGEMKAKEEDDPASPSDGGRRPPPEQFSIVSTKGKQFLKRVVGVPGDRIGVSNSNPYVALRRCEGDVDFFADRDDDDDADCTTYYRVDNTGEYSRPDLFPDESWNRMGPTMSFEVGPSSSLSSLSLLSGSNAVDHDRDVLPRPLARGQYFVAGDNGYRSVDSRVWGPLKEKYIFGTADWVIYPMSRFGPIRSGPSSLVRELPSFGEGALSPERQGGR